jgi:predicted dehydrogenase
MKFMIAGLGSIGRRHLRNLQALGEKDILLYRSHRSSLPDDELAGLPVETDLQAALGRRPDAVIIANPTALHLEVAIPAAQAGAALLIEKPISHSPAGWTELRKAAGAGAPILTGYHFRHHPTLQQAARLLQEGAIGNPISAHAHWGEYLPAWHPWEDFHQSYSARADLGGGVILTLSHPLDYLLWLLGPVQAVSAFTTRTGLLEKDGQIPDVEDSAEIVLRFTSKAQAQRTGAAAPLASLHLDYLQRPPAHWLHINGESGYLHWDNQTGVLEFCRAAHPERKEIFSPPDGFTRNDLFVAEMQHFIQVARRETQPLCSLEDGLNALALALAALQSAEQSGAQQLIQPY